MCHPAGTRSLGTAAPRVAPTRREAVVDQGRSAAPLAWPKRVPPDGGDVTWHTSGVRRWPPPLHDLRNASPDHQDTHSNTSQDEHDSEPGDDEVAFPIGIQPVRVPIPFHLTLSFWAFIYARVGYASLFCTAPAPTTGSVHASQFGPVRTRIQVANL